MCYCSCFKGGGLPKIVGCGYVIMTSTSDIEDLKINLGYLVEISDSFI